MLLFVHAWKQPCKNVTLKISKLYFYPLKPQNNLTVTYHPSEGGDIRSTVDLVHGVKLRQAPHLDPYQRLEATQRHQAAVGNVMTHLLDLQGRQALQVGSQTPTRITSLGFSPFLWSQVFERGMCMYVLQFVFSKSSQACLHC